MGWIILAFIIPVVIGAAIDKIGKQYAQRIIYEERVKIEANAQSIIYVERTKMEAKYKAVVSKYNALLKQHEQLQNTLEALKKKYSRFDKIIDAEAEAQRVLDEAKAKAQWAISAVDKIIQEAHQKAREIAGNALDAKENALLYERTAKSMKNIVLGYGNDYLIPSHTLFDDLAETYGYEQAAKDYKAVREKVRSMVMNNQAASCDYSDTTRRQTAIAFIIDAFNGKADTILARAKYDNFGILRQKLTDAFNLVNYNGAAFRNARINEAYFQLRLEELKLACLLAEIRRRNAEEQRRLNEQIREEAKVKREIEKAQRDAKKQEELLQKAMDKARAQLEKANAEQRAAYEAQIAELERKYKEAEERNKRASSMAQQTKSGYVYIISNEGSFGQHVYKIGMTRRLEPLERIRELSNASVPFAFDVHAFIWSEDAPALENMLHKKFALAQVNKVNFRKEFFRLSLADIRAGIEDSGIQAIWTTAAEAAEYRETIAIEKAIQDNPQARQDWLNHQLELEAAVATLDDVSDEDLQEVDE